MVYVRVKYGTRLQTALGAALAKSARDQAAFDRIVSAFFALDGPLSPFRIRIRSGLPEGLAEVSRGLLTGVAGELALRIQNATERLELAGLTAPTQRGAVIRQAHENLGWDRIAQAVVALRAEAWNSAAAPTPRPSSP